jgi:hypothetical protein
VGGGWWVTGACDSCKLQGDRATHLKVCPGMVDAWVGLLDNRGIHVVWGWDCVAKSDAWVLRQRRRWRRSVAVGGAAAPRSVVARMAAVGSGAGPQRCVATEFILLAGVACVTQPHAFQVLWQ